MAGRTGYTPITNGDAPDFGPDITSIAEHFDPLIGETVADAASLPASSNWVGRTVYVQSDKSVRTCTALPNTWEELPDQGWVTITTFGANWTANSGYTPRIRVVGKRRDIFGVVTRGAGASTSNILTIPSGHRPGVHTFLSANVNSEGQVYNARVSSGGILQIDAGYSLASLAGGYPLQGSWFVD